MTKLYLDTATLSAKADELEELNALLLAEMQELDDTEATLAGMWDGPAKDAFRQAYHRDRVQLGNFYAAINLYITQLRAIITIYQVIERRNEERARNRSYCGC